MPKSGKQSKNELTIEEQYKKLEHRDHVLELPDTYIGSTEKSTEVQWVYNEEDGTMEKVGLDYAPGLYKIFDEILVNAIDQSVRSKDVTHIKVTIDQEKNIIKVWNNGVGIPPVINKDHKIYVPEMIFGHLLTSTNYSKRGKIVGGKNGYGAKLANIFSTYFKVETVGNDLEGEQKKYSQEFTDNMSVIKKPKITKYSKDPYTEITFSPDLKRFGMKELENDIVQLMKRRVYDTTACTRDNLKVTLNGKVLKTKSFEKYIDLYVGNKRETRREYYKYESGNKVWEIGACMNPDPEDLFQHISFVNGISTPKGGSHVNYVANQIVNKLVKFINEKYKNRKDRIEVKPSYVKNHLWVFVRATIEDPSFSSQTKEDLTSSWSSFGCKFDLDEEYIKKLANCGIMAEALSDAEHKHNKELAKKTDGKKKKRIQIPKLEDANKAGTIQSHKCTLILTEGDSAKSAVMSGLGEIGRDYYGIFPLRGKLLNVREATKKKLLENAEINSIKQIIGLQQNKKYNDVHSLRYGKILILTDQDVDGSHIKGLIMNLFHAWWPELLKIKGFIQSLATPIVKATKGKQEKVFYTLTEYSDWKKNATGGWQIKYYKGLGTSTRNEFQEYFKDLTSNLILYSSGSTPKKTDKALKLAFEKNKADRRKQWLIEYEPNSILEQNVKVVEYSQFVHNDLIHFSMADLVRSTPNICDGLKPSQRKVLFSAFKRNLKNQIKVSQFAGSVAELSAYHHGEASLNSTIVSMAYNFIGTNNINTLVPAGQFGTRVQGGKDAASPRYIFTHLEDITRLIYNESDFPLLKYLDDDGKPIEPEWYIPIIPMGLVNGANGIGTGFSTDIPCYNPEEIIELLIKLLQNKSIENYELLPWYHSFKGTIRKDKRKGIYNTVGIYSRIDDTHVQITELPIGMWTEKYQEHLNKLMITTEKKKEKNKTQFIKDFDTQCTDINIDFTLEFPSKKELDELLEDPIKFEKTFKLVTNININNMHLFDKDHLIKKYGNPIEIVEEFYEIRLEYYQKRREYLLEKLKKELEILQSKVRFINGIMNEEFVIFKKNKKQVTDILINNDFPKLSEKEDTELNFDYLLRMQVYSFTEEKIKDLENKYKKKKKELEEIESKTYKDLWMDDLNELLDYYKKWCKVTRISIPSKVSKKKK